MRDRRGGSSRYKKPISRDRERNHRLNHKGIRAAIIRSLVEGEISLERKLNLLCERVSRDLSQFFGSGLCQRRRRQKKIRAPYQKNSHARAQRNQFTRKIDQSAVNVLIRPKEPGR